MLLGVLFFSGFLYAYVGSGIKLLAMFVPIGGVASFIAWLDVALAAMRR